MTETAIRTARAGRDLSLTCHIAAAPALLFRAWSEPALLVQWFTPAPWRTASAEVDLRTGGVNTMVMQGPEGESFTHRGVYLEVVTGRRLVFTDAFTSAWQPSDKAFMLATIDFTPEDGGTRYSALVRHWSDEDCDRHEAMGFHAGWAKATEQLAALVRGL